MYKQMNTKERSDRHMAVSKAVVPMLTDEVAEYTRTGEKIRLIGRK